MHLTKSIKSIALMATVLLASTPVMGQDLLARQAPVDKKVRAVDTLALQSIIEREEAASPSSSLYQDWDNRYAHKATELPESYRIDLRDFCMPTPSRVITSNFGARWGRMHKGLDIKVYIGDTIRAAFSGKVRVVKYEPKGYGNYVVIRHHNGLETIYGHMSKQLVRENQVVRAGDPIGLGGNTGRSTGSHLHFETRLCGVALNPALFFDFRKQDVTGDFYTFRKSTVDRESAEATRLRGKNDGNGYNREDVTGKATANNQQQNQQRSSGASKFHKVQAGETVYSIARKYNISVEKLAEMNHLGKELRIRPGQLLKYS
ncbi:MAG: peptidoglycan DD-metalloendopeptidase family protein [Prevotella sp.]|nr:peptidoglycan DD-metalloendopeptidase family protein [Prevotella sp.]